MKHNTHNIVRELILWVTTDCNLRCSYCYAAGGDSRDYMDRETAFRAIDIMNALSDRYVIQFAGGEPLLHFGLVKEIVGYTAGRNVSFQLQTNGTLITEDIANDLKKLDIAVGVSLDGIPDINNRTRCYPDGKGSAADILRGIQLLGKAGIRTGTTCVVTSENAEHLPELITLLSFLGNVEGISLDFLRHSGRAVNGAVQPADAADAARAVKAALKQADMIAGLGGKRVHFREVKRMKHLLMTESVRSHRCYFDAAQCLMIKPDGEAYPCASLSGYPEFRLGNIADTGFQESLTDNLFEKQGKCTPLAACRACPDFTLCGGPCPAQVYCDPSPDALDDSPECRVRKEMMNYAVRETGALQAVFI